MYNIMLYNFRLWDVNLSVSLSVSFSGYHNYLYLTLTRVSTHTVGAEQEGVEVKDLRNFKISN